MNDKFDFAELAKLHAGTTAASQPLEDSVFFRIPADKDAKLVLRFLPGIKGKPPYHVFQAHKVNGKFVICPRVQVFKANRSQWVAPPQGNDCPVCAYYKAKYAKYNPGKPPQEVEDKLRAIKPMVRVAWNCIVRTYKDKKNQGPFIFTMGIQVAQRIWAAILGDPANGKPAKGDIMDPKTGRDWLLIKKNKPGSSWPDYSGCELLEPSAAGTPEEFQKWVGAAHDLAACNPPTEFAVLDKFFRQHQGILPQDDTSGSEYDEPSEQPKKSTVKVQTPKKSQAEIDADEIGADPEFMNDLNQAASTR